ncbi:MAG: response regulator transcription factor [Archangiaceae bacterium]|nr:response regulator transcription factor [Archangiaceae bacterium]
MKVLVADDEAPARRRLIRLLAAVGGVEVVGEAENGERAIAAARQLAPDVLLLDVEMPGLDGLAVAAAEGMPPVIFITAHEEHAVAAFGVNAVDYLLKPVAAARLADALGKVRLRFTRPGAACITTRSGNTVQFFAAAEIARFSASQKYTVFHVAGDEHLTKESLDALETRLEPAGFVRVHRAELVRVSAIRAFTATALEHHVTLESGERVPVSRRYAAALKARLAQGRSGRAGGEPG